LHATDNLGPVSFPSSYGEYAAVRIGVICNYAPDDELDNNGNPALHFQHDVDNFYNATMRNLLTTNDVSHRIPCRCSNADSSVFCHCDGCVHVDGSHIRLVGNHRTSSSFAVPTSVCKKHNCMCSLQVRKSCWCHGVWAPSSRQHPTMAAHEFLPKVSDSE